MPRGCNIRSEYNGGFINLVTSCGRAYMSVAADINSVATINEVDFHGRSCYLL